MRYIYSYILKDLKKKMVFVGGPRQVGKTTLAVDWIAAAALTGAFLLSLPQV